MELRGRDPEPVSESSIFFGDQKVGDIKESMESGGSRYHACLQVPGAGYGQGLAQGFGKTPEAAVKDAIKSSRDGAQRYLAGLLDLEKSFIESV